MSVDLRHHLDAGEPGRILEERTRLLSPSWRVRQQAPFRPLATGGPRG